MTRESGTVARARHKAEGHRDYFGSCGEPACVRWRAAEYVPEIGSPLVTREQEREALRNAVDRLDDLATRDHRQHSKLGAYDACDVPQCRTNAAIFWSADAALANGVRLAAPADAENARLREALERAWEVELRGEFIRLAASVLPSFDDEGNQASDVAEGMAEHFFAAALAATPEPAAEPGLDVDVLARALHKTGLNEIGKRPGSHGKFTGRCICNGDAEAIAREYAAALRARDGGA